MSVVSTYMYSNYNALCRIKRGKVIENNIHRRMMSYNEWIVPIKRHTRSAPNHQD